MDSYSELPEGSSCVERTVKGQSFTVLIYPRASLEHTTDTIISTIVKILPSDSSIRDLHTLREHIRDLLRSQGYRSENLYEIEVSGHGDRVEFVVDRLNSEISNTKYGYVEVSEGTGPDRGVLVSF
jgi:hypothetical protein